VDVETVVGPLLLPRDDRVITSYLRDAGVWEPFETHFVRSTLRPGHTFVDIGAHVGYFSLLAATCVGPSGQVIAFEPEPRNLSLLRQNLTRSGFANTRVVPFAATATSTWMSLALEEENRGGHHLVALGQAETVVRCVRPDDVLPARVDFVKIDVQGFDHEVVAGLERTLAANPSMTIMVELSRPELERRGIDVEVVLAWYASAGFILSMFDRSGAATEVTVDAVIELHRTGNLPDDATIILRLPTLAQPHELGLRPRKVVGIAVNDVPEGLVVVDPRGRRVHHLNQTAALVFEMCTGTNELAEIAARLQEAFGLGSPPMTEVADCLRHLHDEGLVT
jgi:FkbM family methyltransferase